MPEISRNRKSVFSIMIFFALIIVLCPISVYSKSGKAANKTVTQEESEPAKETSGAGAAENEKDPAKEASPYDYDKPSVEEESYAWMVIKTLIVLAALVGGFYYFYRFVTKKTGLQIVGREVATVLSILPVGQNKFIQIIDVAGRVLVVGVTDSNINLITEVREKDEIDRIRLLSSKSTPVTAAGGFQDYIAKYINRFFKKDSGTSVEDIPDYDVNFAEKHELNPDRMDYLKRQRERLKKINGNDDEE